MLTRYGTAIASIMSVDKSAATKGCPSVFNDLQAAPFRSLSRCEYDLIAEL